MSLAGSARPTSSSRWFSQGTSAGWMGAPSGPTPRGSAPCEVTAVTATRDTPSTSSHIQRRIGHPSTPIMGDAPGTVDPLRWLACRESDGPALADRPVLRLRDRRRRSGPLLPGVDVALLLGGHGVERDTQGLQLEARDLP